MSKNKVLPIGYTRHMGGCLLKIWAQRAYHSVRGKSYKVQDRVFSLYTNVKYGGPFLRGFSQNDPLPGREVVSKNKVLPIGYTRHMGGCLLKIWV